MKKRAIGILLTLAAAIVVKIQIQSPKPIPVSFSRGGLPKVQARLQNRNLFFDLSLSGKYGLYLSREIFDSIEKKQFSTAQWQDVSGKSFCSPLFLVKGFHLGSLPSSIDVIPEDIDSAEETQGLFNWPLNKIGLLLDFPRNRIYPIKRSVDLSRLGFSTEKMSKLACDQKAPGVCFWALIGDTPARFCITPSANRSVVRSSFPDGKKREIKLGSTVISDLDLQGVSFAEGAPFDVILGRDFLSRHIVYVPRFGQEVYVGSKHPNASFMAIELNMEFTKQGLPAVEAKVGGEGTRLIVDTGSSWEVNLVRKSQQIEKLVPIKTAFSVDFNGVRSPVALYPVSFSIGGRNLKNVVAAVGDRCGVDLPFKSPALGSLDEEQLGTLGLPILHRSNLYMDCKRKKLIFARKDELLQFGIKLEGFCSVPFTEKKRGIIVHAESDFGPLSLLVDTGTTASLILPQKTDDGNAERDTHGNPSFRTSELRIGEAVFANQRFYPFAFDSSYWEVDGVLGMNFLKEQAVYIDYPNRLLYVEKKP